MASRCKAYISALADSKAAISLRSQRSAKRPSRRSGRRISPLGVSLPKSNSMARGFSPTLTVDALTGNDSASAEKGVMQYERIELYAGVVDACGIARNHCAHSDRLRDHARHREACRLDEAHWSHRWDRYCADAGPLHPRRCLVGYVPMAADRSHRDWGLRHSVATAATADTKEGKVITLSVETDCRRIVKDRKSTRLNSSHLGI